MNAETRATRAGQLLAMKQDLTAEDVGRTLETLQAVRDSALGWSVMTEADADISLRLFAYLQLQLEEYEDRDRRMNFLLGGD